MLNPRAHELGIYFCGGRGKQSRKTPDELVGRGRMRKASMATELVRTSRLTAKIDNNAIADGFQIYLHSFIVSSAGEWAVVQQGMNERSGLARRYHWHSPSVRDFTCEPHTGIVGEYPGRDPEPDRSPCKARARGCCLKLPGRIRKSLAANWRKITMPSASRRSHTGCRPEALGSRACR